MFYISGVISSATLKRLVRYMHTEATNKELYVYINSPGGCTRSALAIYEILRSFAEKTGAKVITQTLDECYSAALIVYLAGDVRFSTQYATFMIHEVQVEEGKDKRAKGYKQTATELEKETKILFSIIKKRSKIHLGTIRRKIQKTPDGDWLFESDEALRWGIVQELGFYLPDPPPEEEDEDTEILLEDDEEDGDEINDGDEEPQEIEELVEDDEEEDDEDAVEDEEE